jgi:geranylgeranyl pyrophosphate synthase
LYAAGKHRDQMLFDRLSGFGLSLGLAFQYVDDLLDAGMETAFSSIGILGEQEVRRRADMHTHEALAALASFGESAESLRVLAQFMLKRGM